MTLLYLILPLLRSDTTHPLIWGVSLNPVELCICQLPGRHQQGVSRGEFPPPRETHKRQGRCQRQGEGGEEGAGRTA